MAWPKTSGPGAVGSPAHTAEVLDRKRRRAFELVKAYQLAEREAFRNAPLDVYEIARFKGLLEKPVIRWEQARRWSEAQCDLMIERYGTSGPRYVW